MRGGFTILLPASVLHSSQGALSDTTVHSCMELSRVQLRDSTPPGRCVGYEGEGGSENLSGERSAGKC